MRRALLLAIISVVLILILIAIVLHTRKAPSSSISNPTSSIEPSPPSLRGSDTPPLQSALLGATILRDYANTNRPAENDLTLMSRLMDNSLLLLKSAGDHPLSANEDWAALFRGSNSIHERFLPENHPALNDKGQLIDRWGTPLFFHALGAGRYELRSAGPDRKLWTADDIHRNSDGSFRHGDELNSTTLYAPSK